MRVGSACAPASGQVGGGAARHHAVHHQAVAEAGVGDAQDVLAQDAAVGVDEREGGVVADGADVAEVVGEALQLAHQRAQVDRPGRHLEAERCLDGAGEGDGVGDGAVARYAAGELGGLVQRGAGEQAVDAFVHVAEPLFQPHHGLAVAGEAEMAGLDDAGVHGTDRDLVQRRADGREECVRIAAGGCRSRAPNGSRTPQRP